jgi:hypothetical protein
VRLAVLASKGVVLASLPALASCGGMVSRTRVLSFLEAIQRPFDLNDRSWLGIPAALSAHLVVSASLAGTLAWFWRPKATAVLLGILILTKEAVDLMIISLYQPLSRANAYGSAADIFVSIVGGCLGLWVGSRARQSAVDNG